jgi:hypothetical protein
MRKKTGIPYIAHILGVTAIAVASAIATRARMRSTCSNLHESRKVTNS